MKVFRIIPVAMAAIFFFASCQKEMSVEQGLSEGTLKEDGLGGCLPSTVNGIFKEDSVLNATNFIEVQINVTQTGTFIINSDTINGYSFHGGGMLDAAGINTVRLYGHGTPIDPGINTFTIRYDSSVCMIDVPVVTVGPPGVYTLGGAGSNCTGVLLNGTYMVSVPMIPTNTATVDVNVTTTGSYTMTTPVVNGISFSASGDFTATGPQTVTLNATGTPTAAGAAVFAIAANTSSCSFTVNIQGTAAPAVYTLGGAGSACTGFVAAGTYAAGTAMTAGNTVTLDVNVTTAGPYTISTTSANGVTFSKIGIFAATGPQTITLTATGTPVAAGVISYTVNGGTGTCTFNITYTGAGSAAVYTMAGAGGACTGATVAGTYTAGTALTASNTATVSVNVTTAGTYTLTTNAVNGMTFSKSGTFATTGPQNVVLTGTGTPVAAGTNTFTTQTGTGCTFTVTVAAGTPVNYFTCTIAGVPFTFNVSDTAFYVATGDLVLGGYSTAAQTESFALEVQNQAGTPVTTGTYTMAGSGAVYQIFAEYTDPSGAFWDPSDGTTVPIDPFTITITSFTANRVTGTFSGTIRDSGGTGTTPKVVANGTFSVPFQ